MSDQPPQNPGPPPPDPQQPPQPPQNPYQPYAGPGYSASGVPQWVPDHKDATTVLILGIVGMAVCQLVAPFAWIKGARAKKEIDASGGTIGGRSQVMIGYVLGIVGSALLALSVVGFILYIVIVVVAFSAGA